MRTSLQTQLERLAVERWVRHSVRILLRSGTLAIAIVCVSFGFQLLFDLRLERTWVIVAALSVVILGLLLILRRPMRATEVARRLDRRFQLKEQLSTALELDPRTEGVGAYLHGQSHHTLGQIRRLLAKERGFPWPELLAAAAMLPVLGGLLLLANIAPLPPDRVAEPLPPLAAASTTDTAIPEEPFQQPGNGQTGLEEVEVTMAEPGAIAALELLADALRDQSVTRPAAAALDRGDPAEAATLLREVADQADSLSNEARANLSRDLAAAAEQIEAHDANLAEQIRAAAEGIEPERTDAGAALEDLADAIEQLSQRQRPDQSQSSSGTGQSALPGQQREQSRERLGVDGVPLELEGGEQGDLPTSGGTPGQSAGSGSGGSGGNFMRGNQSGERVTIGDDPLRIPVDLRDVVQDYFSP